MYQRYNSDLRFEGGMDDRLKRTTSQLFAARSGFPDSFCDDLVM